MIGRLLARVVSAIAERLMDHDWLETMRFRERVSRRAVAEHEQRHDNVIEAAYLRRVDARGDGTDERAHG